MKKLLTAAAIAGAAAFGITGQAFADGHACGSMTMAEMNWASAELMANVDKIILEVSFFIILREGYPVESNTLKMLETYNVKFKISTIKIPNISSSKFRLNFNYSNLPTSLIDVVKKNNLYESTKLVE